MDLASALYGPNGPITGTQVGPTPNTISGGRADTPAPDQWRGQPLDQLPGTQATVVPNQPGSPPPTPAAPPPQQPAAQPQGQPRSLGEAFYGDAAKQPDPAGAAPQYALPEGYTPDPTMLSEFSQAARELRVDKAGAERLLAMHARAAQASQDQRGETWAAETRDYYADNETLTATAATVRESLNALGDHGREALRLLGESKLGNNLAIIRTLEELIRGSRRY